MPLFRRSWRWICGLIQPHAAAVWVLLGMLLLAGLSYALLHRADRLSTGGRFPAVETHRSPQATADLLRRFEKSCQLDETALDQKVSEACAQAAQAATDGIPYSDLAGERRLLRWLAANDPPALAVALDRATAVVPAGVFEMGSGTGRDDERPLRPVTLDAFLIDRYEATNVQYARFIAASGRTPPRYWTGGTYAPGLADSPVVGVSWQDAADYCAWAGKRLPSEAEWEKACRGTDGRAFPWGNDWQADFLNITESRLVPGSQYLEALWPVVQAAPEPGQPGLYPVGSFTPGASPVGVLDMAGNAAEWVMDWYNPKAYQELPATNPLSLAPPWNHSLRGGGWWVFRQSQADAPGLTAAFESRCAARSGSHSADDPRVGFRCAQ